MDAKTEYAIAMAGREDKWVPACGGSETPFTARSGKRLLYCFNPAVYKHAYLDLDTDTILTNEEALAHLNPI